MKKRSATTQVAKGPQQGRKAVGFPYVLLPNNLLTFHLSYLVAPFTTRFVRRAIEIHRCIEVSNKRFSFHETGMKLKPGLA